jgi:cellulose synthase (UDP-forming)
LRHSSGDVILVLDADFVVKPRLLSRTVGLLDERVALVQTPQTFETADVIQGALGIWRWAVEEQNFFFRCVIPSMCAWGSAICVGSSFIVRRDALGDEGFPEGALSEDVYLSYVLRSRGFATLYLNEALSAGAAAETSSAYVSQRTRWAAGSCQFPFLAYGPLRAPGLRLMDRLMFLAMPLFWWSQFGVLAAILCAPAVYFFSGVPVFNTSSVDEALLFILPRIVSSSMVMFWISEGRVAPVVSDVRKMLALPFVLLSMVSIVVRPFGRPFGVTAKPLKDEGMTINWDLMWPHLAMAIVTLTGLVTAAFTDLGPARLDEYVVPNAVFGCYVLWLLILTCFACVDLPASAFAPGYRETVRGSFWSMFFALLGWNRSRRADASGV